MTHSSDIIIVGAGAAGIACAHKLNLRQKDFVILEARSRIGGRIYSLTEQDNPLSLELGAEFIHGVPKTNTFFGQFEIPFYDAIDSHLVLKNSRLQKFPNFFEKMEKLMAKIPRRGSKDKSVDDFIKGLKNVDPFLKSQFCAFVEGFHAADLNRIGIRALKDTEETNENDLNGTQMFRPLARYDLVLKRLSETFEPARIHLQTVVEQITWEPGAVEVLCRRGSKDRIKYKAKKLVMTAPVGVLKSGSIRWYPEPKFFKSYLPVVNMGHVQKIIFHFHERFWEKLSKEPVSFLHCGPENYFPTWWTFQPLRTPYMVAWQGGPKAWELSAKSEDERADLALATLAKLTRIPQTSLSDLVKCRYTHNWAKDPFAAGAYSYVSVDGSVLAASAKRSEKNTLYFAGEGMMAGASRGTVHGALTSGQLILA